MVAQLKRIAYFKVGGEHGFFILGKIVAIEEGSPGYLNRKILRPSKFNNPLQGMTGVGSAKIEIIVLFCIGQNKVIINRKGECSGRKASKEVNFTEVSAKAETTPGTGKESFVARGIR